MLLFLFFVAVCCVKFRFQQLLYFYKIQIFLNDYIFTDMDLQKENIVPNLGRKRKLNEFKSDMSLFELESK